jgi:DNA-binding beta-propeller fold protein YncE
VTLRPSLAELQPVVDGRADTVTIEVRGTTTTGRSMPAKGTLAVVGPAGTLASWPLTTSRWEPFTWDGRVDGVIAAGEYTLRATLKGPQGAIRTATAPLTVTKAHLPYRVRTLFDLPVGTGNQQGLAERGGTVYVTTDLGGGETRIDLLDRETGTLIRSIQPLPLGHGAEVTVGPDGLLYVVNGGPLSPTKIFIVDPVAGAIRETLDLGALGASGLVAFDSANDRLLVYTGRPGSYSVTPVGLDGTAGASVPLQDEGVPQGLELVHGELWLYTTVESGSRISRFDPATGALLGTIDLALNGEAEGLAYDPSDGEVLVGAHSPDRVGILERVPDE